MNSLFDRLGDMLKDYIENDQDIFSKPSDKKESREEVVDEIDAEPENTEPVSNKGTEQYNTNTIKPDSQQASQAQKKTFTFNKKNQQQTFTKKPEPDYKIYKAPKIVPPQVRKDFDFFGLPLSAGIDDCKDVYKKLLKVYHPDKHSSDPKKLKTATEYSARVNTAYKRLIDWIKQNK